MFDGTLDFFFPGNIEMRLFLQFFPLSQAFDFLLLSSVSFKGKLPTLFFPLLPAAPFSSLS